MSDAEIVIGVRSDGQGARIIRRDLDAISKSGDNAKEATGRLEKQMKSTAGAAQLLSRAMGALGAALSVGAVVNYTSAWTDLNSRVNIAAGSMDKGTAVMGRLNEMARRTYTSLEQTAETYLLNATAMRELGYSTQQTLDWVESVNNALVVSGAKGQRAESVMNALSKAMAMGKLSGENLNTVISTGGRVAEALAKSMGVSTNELRKLGMEGKITTAEIVGLTKEMEVLRKEADSMPATIQDAFVLLKNALLSTIGAFDQAAGASAKVSSALISISDHLPFLIKMLGVGLVAALNGVVIAKITATQQAIAYQIALMRMAAGGGAATAAIVGLKAAMTGFMAVMGGVPGIIIASGAALWFFWEDIVRFMRGFKPFGLEIARTFAFVADVVAGTFGGIVEVIKKSIAEIEIMLFKMTDSIAGTWAGKKLGIEVYTPSLGALRRSQQSMSEAFNFGFDRATRNGFLAREMASDLTLGGEATLDGMTAAAGSVRAVEAAIKDVSSASQDLVKDVDKNSPVAKAFESLANQIDDGFRDAFRSAFTGAGNGWKGLIEGMKNSFKTLLADLAYMAIARPIVLSVVGGIGGVMGVSGSAQASILGGLSGGSGGGLLSMLSSGGGNLTSLLSGGLSGLNSPIFGAGSMIGKGINSIGSALGLNNANFIGPMMPGTSNLASAFTPMAGIAGFGGNMLGNLLFGNRGIGASIGGTLGAVGGTAVGASMGTILGMAGGPVGAALGGFLGNAIGGLFGGKPKRETLGTSYNIGPDGMLGVRATSTKGADISKAKEFAGAVTTALNTIAQAMGATFSQAIPLIETNIGKKDPGTFMGGSRTRISTTPGDVAAIIREVLKSDTYLTGANADVMAVARRSAGMGSSAAQIVDDIALANMVFGATKTPADEAAAAIAEVNEEFDKLYARAEKLGMPIDKVTEALEKQRDLAIGTIKAMQAGFQSMEAMKATFDSWLYDQSISSVSSLSPMQKLTAAQGNFGSLLAQAQGGDYTVTGQLLQAGQQLLQIGQSMYASSVDFAMLESFVRSSITQIARDLDIPGYASGTTSARRGMAWVGESGPELVNFSGGERVYNSADSARMQARSNARADEQAQEISAMRQDIQNMNRQISRLVNKMMVAG